MPSRLLLWMLLLAGLIGLGVAGFFVLRPSPAPEVVTPRDPETLDPAVVAYTQRYIDQARVAPRDPMRHAALGLVYEANQLWDEARACFHAAAELDPDRPLIRLHEAINAADGGDLSTALALLEALVDDHGDLAPAVQRLGDALLELGRLEEAEARFRRVIELAPQAPEGYIGVADVQLRSGDPAAAEAMLQQALQREPGNRTAHYLLGLALQAQGRDEEAERELAIGANAGKSYLHDEWTLQLPNHARQLPRVIRRSLAYMNAGRHAEAAVMLEQVLPYHPRNVDLLNNLAVARMYAGQLDEAEAHLQTARAADPQRYATFNNLASVSAHRGDFRAALRWIDRSIELAPEIAQSHLIHSQCLGVAERFEEALAVIDHSIQLDPSDPTAHVQRSRLARRLGRFEIARDAAAQAARLSPSSVPAQLEVVEAYMSSGFVNEAAAAMATARRLAPNDPRLREIEQRVAEAMRR